MDKLIQKLSQKNQIDFIKLSVELREIERINKEQINNFSIYRFYQENNFDKTKTIKSIKNHLIWKSQSKAYKQIYFNDYKLKLEWLRKFDLKINYYGESKKGRPIGIISIPDNIAELLIKFDTTDALVYFIQSAELFINCVVPALSKIYKKQIDGTIWIYDIKNLNKTDILKNPHLVTKFKELLKTYQKNYPQITKEIYIINTGIVIQNVWKLYKYMVSSSNQKKIQFLNDDYLATLKTSIDMDKFPKELGGNCEILINEYKNIWDDDLNKYLEETKIQQIKIKLFKNIISQIQIIINMDMKKSYEDYFLEAHVIGSQNITNNVYMTLFVKDTCLIFYDELPVKQKEYKNKTDLNIQSDKFGRNLLQPFLKIIFVYLY